MRLHYERPNDLSKLHDELLAALPALRPTEGGPVLAVEGLGDDIWLTVPDDADQDAIAAVVAAHDPTPSEPGPTKNEILLLMLDTIDPEEPDTTVLWLVLQEALTP